MSAICQSCQSDNIQKLSLVYEGGLTQLDGKQSGVGVGIGAGGLGFGLGSSKLKGVNQSMLSKRAAPPAKKRMIRNAIFYGVGVWFVWNFIPGNLGMVLILALGGGLHVFLNYKYNRDKFPMLFGEWDLSYLCQKCGVISTPESSGKLKSTVETAIL